MTELRDARLRKALEEAPDARVQPLARTREAIHAAAHAAVQPAWRRWWQAGGRSRAPWAAGLATFVVATLVTVIWHDEEVPGARPESETVAVAPRAQAPAPAPPAVVAPSPAPAPLPPPAALPAPAPSPAPAARRAERQRQEAATQRVAPSQARDEAALADAAPAAAPAPREQRSAAAAMPPAAAPAPLRAERAAPSPALAPAPAIFTQVRVEARGRSVVLPADQAGLLPALIVRLLASPVVATGAASGTASLRLELAQGNDAVGVLERLGEHWRWAPVDPQQEARLLRPPSPLDDDLREEAARLLR